MPDFRSPAPAPTPFDRPSARAAGNMPVQRGNYGIPPRQSQRSMDIIPPRPTPVAAAPALAAAPIPAPSPSQSAMTAEQIAVPARPAAPMYTNTPQPQPSNAATRQPGRVLPKLRLALLVVGALLALGGLARWATAGSTAGNIIAAGAVAANDGSTMTIQFTADDGQLHKFTSKSNAELIPGSGVQVAYRSGAPDKTAKQVAPIQAAHSLGISLLVTGLVLLAGSGLTTLIMRRRP